MFIIFLNRIFFNNSIYFIFQVHFALNHSSAESSPVSTSNRDVKFENETSGTFNNLILSSIMFFSPVWLLWILFIFSELETIGPLIKVIHPDTVHFNWNGTEFVGSINVENISDKNVLYKVRFGTPRYCTCMSRLKRKALITTCWF